jgi:rhamnose utilization protein RhaD (predicted bifunctional aldolase and dehydrogenase)/NAD(P)-dependent dehydrogenase (short-subunit alcohol dehydrogenase family)
MQNQWDDKEASLFEGELGPRIYTSRLLGREPSLVLHGGGNTSVKVTGRNLFGEQETILYVKGSGADLKSIEASGFAPVRLEPMVRLAQLDQLSDPQMVNALRANTVLASAPSPSVETVLHAVIPHKYVDHTHADAVLTVGSSPNGKERLQQIYGNSVLYIPYAMPGFELARVCAHELRDAELQSAIGMVLLHHGIFSFGTTARESYERMIQLVSRAEDYLREHGAWELAVRRRHGSEKRSVTNELAALRRQVADACGFPVILKRQADERTMSFISRSDLSAISQRGPITPDHIIRTKRVPQLGRDVDAYTAAYRRYFAEHAASSNHPLTMLDPAPRVILDPELGMCVVGRTAADATTVQDLYNHTIDVIERAESLGGYHALPQSDLFAVEYWDLEQAKLSQLRRGPSLRGSIALVTGAASGIGKAVAEKLLSRGAAVVGLDVDRGVQQVAPRTASAFLPLQCDLTCEQSVTQALEQAVTTFGGLDILVLNAGTFPPSRAIEALTLAEWRKVMAVNLDANLVILREAHAPLKLALGGGRVVVIGSKNVPAPGPGAAAYSASKAALAQLARVAALEWGKDGICVNTIHPHGVFDTAIWTEEVLQSRAAQYGVTVDSYRRNNVLGREVASRDVAELVADLCGPGFACTTGAQIPIDGGNERVI